MTPMIIGIAGGTGSGKTTLVKRIKEQFGDVVSVLSHDNYYRRLDHLTYEERCKINYDEPAALDTSLMVYQLDQLIGSDGGCGIVQTNAFLLLVGQIREDGIQLVAEERGRYFQNV